MQKPRGRTTAWLVAVLVAGIIPLKGASQELPIIRVGIQPYESSKAAVYGERSGLFRKYGIDVQTVMEPSGAAGIAALVGGSLDVMMSSMLPILQAHVRGLPVEVVAPCQEYLSSAPDLPLLVKTDSSVHGAADLNGKIVAVTALRDTASLAVHAWIDKNGGDSKTVTFIEVPQSLMLAAIDQGRVSAGVLSSPFFQEGLASGKVRSLGFPHDAIGKAFQSAAWSSTSTIVAKNAAEMQRFARAMHEAILYTNGHPVVDLIASITHLSPKAIEQTPRTKDAEYLNASQIQPVIDVAARYGFIDKSFPAQSLISSVAWTPSNAETTR